MQVSPELESLVVLEQRFGEQEFRRRPRSEVQCFERRRVLLEQSQEERLKRWQFERGRHFLRQLAVRGAAGLSFDSSACSLSTGRKCSSRSPLIASMARNCALCPPLDDPR